MWLDKWVRWVRNLIAKYRVEDPSEPFGFAEINADNVRKLLEEHCLDLTESECYRKLEDMVKPYGLKEEEKVERMFEKAKAIEKEIKEKEKLAKEKPELLYGLEEIHEEIEKIRKGITPNGKRAYEIVKEYGLKKGLPPEEVEVYAEDVRKSVEEALAKRKPKVIKLNIPTMKLYGAQIKRSLFMVPVDSLASIKLWCDKYGFKFIYDYVIAPSLARFVIAYYSQPISYCEFFYDGVNWKLLRCDADVVAYAMDEEKKLLIAKEYEVEG